MAPKAIQEGILKIVSKYTPEELAAAGKLVENSVKVKQAKENAYDYLKIGWVKQTSSKPPKTTTAKTELELIDTITQGYENLPNSRMTTRINLNAKESSVPGMTKEEGWVSYQMKGELQQAKSTSSCFQQMLNRRVGTAVEVNGNNFSDSLEALYPIESDVL